MKSEKLKSVLKGIWAFGSFFLCRSGAAQTSEPRNHKAKEYREMNINPFGPYYAGALRTGIASCFINGKITEVQIAL